MHSYSDLSDQDLIRLTFTERDQLPMAFAREAISRGARLIPALATIVRDEHNWEREDTGWWAVIHASHLLGAIGGTEAISPFIDAFILAEEHDADWLFDEFPSIFGALGPGVIAPLRELASDPSRDWHLRERAMAGLGAVALRHPELETEVFPFIAEIAADTGEDPETRGWAADVLLDLGRAEYKAVLRSLLESGIASHLYTEKHVETMGTKTHLYWYQRDWLDFYSPEELAKRRKRWDDERLNMNDAWTYAHAEEYANPYDGPAEISAEDELEAAFQALPRGERKIGRNEPCPCGSGKKHKKCCLEAG